MYGTLQEARHTTSVSPLVEKTQQTFSTRQNTDRRNRVRNETGASPIRILANSVNASDLQQTLKKTNDFVADKGTLGNNARVNLSQHRILRQ